MTAKERLNLIQASWWAGPSPNAFLLGPGDRPLGVIALPHWMRADGRRHTLPCQQDVFGYMLFDLEFPDEPITCETPRIIIEPVWSRRPLFWRLVETVDGGTLENVSRFFPVLDPLPSFQFLAMLHKAQVWRAFGDSLRRLFMEAAA